MDDAESLALTVSSRHRLLARAPDDNVQPEERPARRMKITVYFLSFIISVLLFGLWKLLDSIQNDDFTVNLLDFCLGVIITIVFFWLGSLKEERFQEYEWLFETDRRECLEMALSYFCTILYSAVSGVLVYIHRIQADEPILPWHSIHVGRARVDHTNTTVGTSNPVGLIGWSSAQHSATTTLRRRQTYQALDNNNDVETFSGSSSQSSDHWHPQLLSPTIMPPQSYCECCQKYFTSQNGLQSHLENSTAHRYTYCKPCGRDFASNKARRQHYANSSAHEDTYCARCDEDFEDSEAYHYHFTSSDEHHYCEQCDEDFDDNEELINHITSSHYCQKCDRGFVNAAALEQHYINSSAHNYCAMCRRDFPYFGSLEQHRQNAAIHWGDVNETTGSRNTRQYTRVYL